MLIKEKKKYKVMARWQHCLNMCEVGNYSKSSILSEHIGYSCSSNECKISTFF